MGLLLAYRGVDRHFVGSMLFVSMAMLLAAGFAFEPIIVWRMILRPNSFVGPACLPDVVPKTRPTGRRRSNVFKKPCLSCTARLLSLSIQCGRLFTLTEVLERMAYAFIPPTLCRILIPCCISLPIIADLV